MKKLIGCIVLGLLLSGCQNITESKSDIVSIVTISFHEYDWVNAIIGENNDVFEVEYLMEDGVDLHGYDPSIEDITKIASADLLIYNGGHSQEWVKDALLNTTNENQIVFQSIEALEDKVQYEVHVDGMQQDTSHQEHSHEEDENQQSSHIDEHVWLSLNNAQIIVDKMTDVIVQLDIENEAMYRENAHMYLDELKDLDDTYKDKIDKVNNTSLIITDRFPFLYLMHDYNIDYYAAFQGCSVDTEASFETVAFLANKASELKVDHLIILENGLEELAKTVASSSGNDNVEIVRLNSMESVSKEDVEKGVTYLSIMEHNLEVILSTLN